MSACPGGEKSGMTPVLKDHPFRAPWGSHPEGGDFVLSLVCSWDALKRSQVEDLGRGHSSEPLASASGPRGARADPDLEEINGQRGATGG